MSQLQTTRNEFHFGHADSYELMIVFTLLF